MWALQLYLSMYQNISDWLTVDYLIAYKALPAAFHIYFHQKSTTSAYDLGDIVTHSLYAQIAFVNALLFPDVYFVFFDVVFCCCFCSVTLNVCVCHLL